MAEEREKRTRTKESMDPEFLRSSEPPILPILPEMRTQIANVMNSLLEEGVLSPKGLDFMESLEDNNIPCLANTAQVVYDRYFEKASQLCALIDAEILHQEPDKENVDRYLKQLKDSSDLVGALKIETEVDKMLRFNEEGNMEGFKCALEQLRVEHQSLCEKLAGYFELRKKVRPIEKVEDQLKLGWLEYDKQLGLCPITVDPEAGPSLAKSIDDTACEIMHGVDRLKSEKVHGESSSGTGLPQAESSGAGECSKPQAGPCGTGESSQPQS